MCWLYKDERRPQAVTIIGFAFTNDFDVWTQVSLTEETNGLVEIQFACSDTSFPTDYPTEQPTEEPTEEPTLAPTEQPTQQPTMAPTELCTTT